MFISNPSYYFKVYHCFNHVLRISWRRIKQSENILDWERSTRNNVHKNPHNYTTCLRALSKHSSNSAAMRSLSPWRSNFPRCPHQCIVLPCSPMDYNHIFMPTKHLGHHCPKSTASCPHSPHSWFHSMAYKYCTQIVCSKDTVHLKKPPTISWRLMRCAVCFMWLCAICWFIY